MTTTALAPSAGRTELRQGFAKVEIVAGVHVELELATVPASDMRAGDRLVIVTADWGLALATVTEAFPWPPRLDQKRSDTVCIAYTDQRGYAGEWMVAIDHDVRIVATR